MKEFGVDRFDRIHERRHRWSGVEPDQTYDRARELLATDAVPSRPRAVEERLPRTPTSHETFRAEAVEDFRDRRVHEPVWLAHADIDVTDGRGAEIPQRDQDSLLEGAAGKAACIHHDM